MFSQHTSSSFFGGFSSQSGDSFSQRIAINQLTTLRSSLEEDLDAYQTAGVPGIGLSCRKLQGHPPYQLIRRIKNSRLKVSSLGWIGCFTGYNGHSRQDALQEARQTLRLAARVQAPVVTVLSGPQAGHIRSNARRLLIDSLEELLPLAENCHVNLALLPVHPKFRREWSFLTHLDHVREVIEKINHPRLGICLSTYHSCHEIALLDRIASLVNQVKLVQVADWARETPCDNSRAMPGSGILRLPEMVQTLEAAGYRGTYELDVWCRNNWRQNLSHVIRRGLDSMRGLDPQLEPEITLG